MILRWVLALCLSLGVSLLTLGGGWWLTEKSQLVERELRQTRVSHQRHQQQLALLRSESQASVIEGLQQSLESLQVQVAQVVTHKPLPAGVSAVEFEQRVMPGILSSNEKYSVKTVRLGISLSVRHALVMIDMLDRVKNATPTWPSEVRACHIDRHPDQQLFVKCVIDIYHWNYESSQQPSVGLPSGGGLYGGA